MERERKWNPKWKRPWRICRQSDSRIHRILASSLPATRLLTHARLCWCAAGPWNVGNRRKGEGSKVGVVEADSGGGINGNGESIREEAAWAALRAEEFY